MKLGRTDFYTASGSLYTKSYPSKIHRTGLKVSCGWWVVDVGVGAQVVGWLV